MKNFQKKITTVTYNETVELRGETLPKVPIQIILPSGKSRFTKYENGIHKIKSIHIGDILAYLQSQGIKNHPRILILAGCLASRGISFWANNKEECMKKKQISWHLCMMYFLAADNTNQPNLQQTAGRLAGIYDDNIPLILYTNVKEDLIKAFNAQEELVKRAKEKELETLGFMREAISKVEITREKISKRGIVANGVKCNLNKVDDDTEFGGENWLEKIEEKEEEKIDPTRAVEGLVYTVSPDNVKETWRAVVSDIIDKIDEADRWISRPSIVKKLWATNNYESLPGLRGTLTQIQQSVKGTNTIGYGLNFRKKKNSEDIELLYHA